jgi:hypothetical protein
MSPRFRLSAVGITRAHYGNYYDTQGFHSLASLRETAERQDRSVPTAEYFFASPATFQVPEPDNGGT